MSELITDIFNYKSKEFFRNLDQKEIEKIPKNHPDYIALRDWEKKKCIEGVNINGIHIWGSLYYILNHHFIDVDQEDGSVDITLPDLRDNDWIIHEEYNRAFEQKLGFTIGSARQISKTTHMVGLTLRQLFLFYNTEAVGVFTSKPDKQTFTKKAQVAISKGRDFLVIPTIDKDWNKEFIRFGVKKSDNTDFIFSKLFLYINNSGNNTEIASGKALKHGSKVYYPDRVGVIEDVKLGDQIYGKDGKLTTVTGVYPQGIVDLYKITFADGRVVECSGDHLWTIKRLDKVHERNKIQTLDTEFIYKNFLRGHFNSKIKKEKFVSRYAVEKNSCLDYPKKKVYVDPYYLGLWLAEGTTNNPSQITTADQEIQNFLYKYAHKIGGEIRSVKRNITFTIQNKKPFGISPLVPLFKKYNLVKNKHIPKEYLFNSKEIRLKLLKGIMDGDGTVDPLGRVQIDLSHKKLAEDVMFLIRSLGMNCRYTTRYPSYKDKNGEKKFGKMCYRIYLGYLTQDVFKLKRKLIRQKSNKRSVVGRFSNQTTILNVEKVEPNYATCISVDNEDKLFLTNDFLPTHNTITWFFMDEIAHAPMKETWEAARPAIRGKFGIRCSPFFSFTGGNIQDSQDAEGIFFNPDANDMLSFENSGKKTCFFMPAIYRSDFKQKQDFISFYENRYSTKIKNPSKELQNLDIYVTDEKRARDTLEHEYEVAKKESLISYQKKKMYAPLEVGDMFIKGNQNPFVHLKDDIDAHIEDLKANPRHLVKEFKNGHLMFSDKPSLNSYPLSESEKMKIDKVGICVVEDPIKDYVGKAYVAGLDPFNTIKTETSVSLGSWYIIKKMTSNLEDPYNESIVSWYNGRNNINQFREDVLSSLTAYDTTLLHEAADDNLTQWFIDKDEYSRLESNYELNKQINPKTRAQNAKGMRPNNKTQNFMLELTLQYLEEELPNGKKGLTRIPDIYLLEQILLFSGDLSPMDALVAFGHALMHLHMDRRVVSRSWDYSNVTEQSVTKKPKDMFKLFTKPKKSII